jgi:hypothetical protein
LTPSSSERADTAAEIDGWVTKRRSAAAAVEPSRTTARKLRNCVSVIATHRNITLTNRPWLSIGDDR